MDSNYTEGAGGLVKERVNKLQQNFQEEPLQSEVFIAL